MREGDAKTSGKNDENLCMFYEKSTILGVLGPLGVLWAPGPEPESQKGRKWSPFGRHFRDFRVFSRVRF